jgi:uncharacterized protein (TIRG00374 family)
MKTSPEERELIYTYILDADPFWIGISIGLGVLSHISRAIRWNYLLDPMGYQPSIKSNILIILMSYLTNLGIPRSGEFLRATALSTYEGVPFQKGFGTIVTERIIDLIILFLIIGLSIILQTEVLLDYFNSQGISIETLIIGLAVLLIIGFVLLKFLKSSNSSFAQKFRSFFGGLIEGALSILKLKNKWAFIGHSLFIWLAYIGMFWVIKFSVPEVIDLGFSELLVGFIAGAFAMTATNGGIGLYPIAVNKSLSIYGISAIAGNAFGWIVWITQTLMVVVLGAVSFLILPFIASKNK